MKSVLVIDAGFGNIASVVHALRFLGADGRTSSEAKSVASADRLILPGVGSFAAGMQRLRALGLDEAIWEAVCIRQRPILGICLGMQLFATHGYEGGKTKGLNLISGDVLPLTSAEVGPRKVPHIGLNTVDFSVPNGVYERFTKPATFYFVHSYYFSSSDTALTQGTCSYGSPLLVAFQSGNIVGTQFHPEKSQSNGLRFLERFMRVIP